MYSRHLIIEQGGTRALVTGLGATLALKAAGLKNWEHDWRCKRRPSRRFSRPPV